MGNWKCRALLSAACVACVACGGGSEDPGGDADANDADPIPVSCVLQPEQQSRLYCDNFRRLFVCPSEVIPEACQLAAVTDGFCCPAQEQVDTLLYSCGYDSGADSARGYVEVVYYDGFDDPQEIRLTELPGASVATVFSKEQAVGATQVSSEPVGGSDEEFWFLFEGDFTFGPLEIRTGGVELDLTKRAGCGQIEQGYPKQNCIVEAKEQGASVATFDPLSAMTCGATLP